MNQSWQRVQDGGILRARGWPCEFRREKKKRGPKGRMKSEDVESGSVNKTFEILPLADIREQGTQGLGSSARYR
jgi:hypothetical protein